MKQSPKEKEVSFNLLSELPLAGNSALFLSALN